MSYLYKIDIKDELLGDYSKTQCLKIVKYIGSDATRFDELISLLLKGPYRLTQRAAWPLSICVQNSPELIYPHLKHVISLISEKDAPHAVKRNVVRLLQFIKIPNSLQGLVADLCFGFLSNKKEPVAVRVFSMTVLANLAMNFPELKHEITALIEESMPFESAGFIARGRKVLKALKK